MALSRVSSRFSHAIKGGRGNDNIACELGRCSDLEEITCEYAPIAIHGVVSRSTSMYLVRTHVSRSFRILITGKGPDALLFFLRFRSMYYALPLGQHKLLFHYPSSQLLVVFIQAGRVNLAKTVLPCSAVHALLRTGSHRRYDTRLLITWEFPFVSTEPGSMDVNEGL